MKAWNAYFTNPTTKIVGVTYQRPGYNNEGDNAVYRKDNRAKVITADQSKAADVERIAQEGPYDIIVDDGSHVPSHINLTYRILWDHLLPGGLYSMEDIEGSG